MDSLMRGLGVSQVKEWMAAKTLDPFTDERLEFMLAQLMALVANRTRKKDEDAYTVQDFLPDYAATEEDRERERQARIRTKMQAVKLKRLLEGKG